MYDFDFQSEASYGHDPRRHKKLVFKGQSVQKIEWKRTGRQVLLIALHSRLTPSVTRRTRPYSSWALKTDIAVSYLATGINGDFWKFYGGTHEMFTLISSKNVFEIPYIFPTKNAIPAKSLYTLNFSVRSGCRHFTGNRVFTGFFVCIWGIYRLV